jgi:hypothetical protein
MLGKMVPSDEYRYRITGGMMNQTTADGKDGLFS